MSGSGFATMALREQLADYVQLSKPRIALVVLVATLAGMWLAAGSALTIAQVSLTLLGVWLASASAGMLNNYVDRDIDRLMSRTAHRATAAGRLEPEQVLRVGLALAGAAFLVLVLSCNLLTASLAMATIYLYVVVYTLWLKRSTDLCTEIGGIAGALPPLIGWAAVSGDIGLPAILLFVVMFLWQPPHFWVLALLRADEYRRAGIPMLPVTARALIPKAKMLLYTAALLPATLSLYLTGVAGPLYAFISTTAGLVYLLLTLDFIRRGLHRRSAVNLFLFSIVYMLLIFTAIFIDSHY
ncbi:MAG: heme o synthase [Halieaceae bacterium]|nr:heme o synthase [Halieaceae bacterium]